MNDYNQTPGDPVVREGGWFEERALREATGFHRMIGQGDGLVPGCDDTAQRIVVHSDNHNDWSTTQTSAHNMVVHQSEKNGTLPSVGRLARRQDSRKDKYLEMAQQLHAEKLAATKKAIDADTAESCYGGLLPQNRARALQTLRGPGERAPLEGPAITLWRDPTILQTGKTPSANPNLPFGADRAFSKTIDEELNVRMA